MEFLGLIAPDQNLYFGMARAFQEKGAVPHDLFQIELELGLEPGKGKGSEIKKSADGE